MPAQPPRSLKGLRVLLDGNYRQQAEGTGISQYSRTLAAGLGALGCEVKWLSGAQSGSADALADQVRFSDPPPAVDGPRRYVQTALRMAAGVLERQVTARPLVDSGVVITEPSAPRTGSTYLAPDLFAKAHYRHMLLRRFTEVQLPDAVDVLHLTAPLPVRMRGVRTVTTIHDLVPIRLPYTTPDNKAEFIHRVRMSTRLSDLIITVSEASKRDIVEILDVDPAKVAVTYQPTDLLPLGPADQDSVPRVLQRYGLAPDGYALFVGALEPKKNLRRLIEAFLEIDSQMPLAIVGRKAWLWDSDEAWLETLGVNARARLRFLGYASREDLRRLYAGAQMFVFPSLYEGFGLPVLEAMTMGCPVVTSKTSSLPEVCGDAALYADPLDRDDIRKRIGQMLGDAALRADLTAKALQQVKRFSFGAYVGRLQEAYAKLG
jgi:glycosyltransferase involved in cell wall biosynthesis